MHFSPITLAQKDTIGDARTVISAWVHQKTEGFNDIREEIAADSCYLDHMEELGGITDILLNFIFVLNLDMGVHGAIYATVIGRAVSFLIYLVHFAKKNRVLAFRFTSSLFRSFCGGFAKKSHCRREAAPCSASETAKHSISLSLQQRHDPYSRRQKQNVLLFPD